MTRALVVGGSGMLAGVSLALARRGHDVVVIARNRERLEQLAAQTQGNLHPLALDYRDTVALQTALEAATKERGPFDLAVVWIHSTAPEAPFVVARFVHGRYFHVLGSASADPSRPDTERRRRFARFARLDYREVVLGFVVERSRSRWLSHEEISQGVLEAIDTDARHFVVGVLEPWEARP
jgi:glycine/D-amino acid oxidase-like deaminating enzyme